MIDSSPAPSVLSQFVQRARELYSLPAVAVRVLELAGGRRVDLRALKECIETDPALTVKILRTVNSSMYGLSRQVSDLQQALALLGVKPLKLLVLGFSLPKNLFAGVEAAVLTRYWRHAMIKAVAAREIGQRIRPNLCDEAMVAGLLQDIGMLALIQDLGDSYVEFLARAADEGGDVIGLETATLGFDHRVLSTRLLEHWGLPPLLARVVGLGSGEPTAAGWSNEELDLVTILQLADLVARLIAERDAAALNELLEAGERECGLDLASLESLISDLEEKVREFAEVFCLTPPGHDDYVSILLLAREQLAGAADEAAVELVSRPRNDEGGNSRITVVSPSAGSSDSSVSPLFVAGRKIAEDRPEAAADATPLDPGLIGRISAAIQSCRRTRQPLSLILAEVDRFADLIVDRSLEGAEEVVLKLESAIGLVVDPGDASYRFDDARLAIILEDCDRAQAVEIARNVLNQFVGKLLDRGSRLSPATVSVGLAAVALPQKNLTPHDMLDAAQRCLFAAQATGGGMLKSIEIFY